MSYKILRSEVSDPHKTVWDMIRDHQTSWVLAAIIYTVSMGILTNWVAAIPILLLTIFPILIYLARVVLPRAVSSFWKQLAEVNKWKFEGNADPQRESGVIFRHGGSISNCIKGIIGEKEFRFFNYQFVEGLDKNRTIYSYTVFAFKFLGSFPQIYLQNIQSSFQLLDVEKVSLPIEFGKKFSLIVPKGYEVEALDIVTPDFMAYLLDNGFSCNLEFVNQEMLVIFNEEILSFELFESNFNKVIGLEEFLKDKLDTSKFQSIGNMSVNL